LVIDATPSAGFLSLGQATARRIARQATERGRVGATLLVHGPAGAGKDRFVDDLLALFFCAEGDLELRPCNVCRGCRDARARAHPDLVIGSLEIWREERSSGESIVAAARRWLLATAGAPVVADRRVVLIEHADRASEQIQNALLKALEEPSDRHIFILVADEASALLPTIRSRCQPLRIGPVARDELAAYLMDRRRLPEDQADVLARISGGLTGAALAFADEPERLSWRRRVQAELLSLLERGRADRFGSARDLLDEAVRLGAPAADSPDEEARTPASAQRAAAMIIVDAWLALSRDLLVAAAGRAELAHSRELAPGLEEASARIGAGAMRRMIDLLERIHDGLRENTAPRLALEAAMLAWPMLPEPRAR
jgi:DNA polymerase III gamma/tau subunit